MNRWLLAAGRVRDLCRHHGYLEHPPAARASLLGDLKSDVERAKAIRAKLSPDEQAQLDREVYDARQHLKNFELAEGSILRGRANPHTLN